MSRSGIDLCFVSVIWKYDIYLIELILLTVELYIILYYILYYIIFF